MDINSRIKLNNCVEMPVLGIGTYKMKQGPETEQAVIHALKKGYRLIDTASIYENEESVGSAIKQSGIPRKDIFITTKLWNSDHIDPERALNESLARLDTEYVDLYLIHWPVSGTRVRSWKMLERIYEDDRCRAIGVSNFTISHLKELMQSTKIVPAVNQVEFSPFLFQKELLEFCAEQGIRLEAYSPLARGQKFNHPTIMEAAKNHGKTPAQVMIRWCLQHDLIVIPKSCNSRRIEENMNVFNFEISKDEMKKLDALNENFRVTWNPENIP